MKKYSDNELKELAKGVFKSQPNDAVVYASESGNFLNEDQYAALPKDDQADYITIENPSVKKVADKKSDKAVEAAVKKITEGFETQIAELTSINDDLREEKKATVELVKSKESVIAGLNDEIKGLKSDMKALNDDLTSSRKELEKKDKEIATLTEKLAKATDKAKA